MCHDFDTGFSTFEWLEFNNKSFWSLTVHDDIYYTHFDCIALGIHYHISCLFAHMQCAMSMMKFIAFFLAYSHSTLYFLLHNARHGTTQHDKTVVHLQSLHLNIEMKCITITNWYSFWFCHLSHQHVCFIKLPSRSLQKQPIKWRLKRNKNFTIYCNYKFFTHSVLNRLNRDYAELDISSFISRRTNVVDVVLILLAFLSNYIFMRTLIRGFPFKSMCVLMLLLLIVSRWKQISADDADDATRFHKLKKINNIRTLTKSYE